MRNAALAIWAVVFPMSAAAEPAQPAPPRPSASTDASRMVTDDCALARRAGKTCVLEVPPEDIGGATPSASGIDVRILRFGSHASLIRLRHDFILEIVKTGEDL
jgi:hypothetical protein